MNKLEEEIMREWGMQNIWCCFSGDFFFFSFFMSRLEALLSAIEMEEWSKYRCTDRQNRVAALFHGKYYSNQLMM